MEIKKGIYRHFKNQRHYEVLGIAKHTETEEELVLYKPLYEGAWAEFCVRPVEMFNEQVKSPATGESVPRFEYLEGYTNI